MPLNRLVLVRYWDHVEFRNIDIDYSTLSPQLREAVGWLIYEDSEKLVILSEKPAVDSIEDVARLKPSGFVILKSAVKEVVRLSERA